MQEAGNKLQDWLGWTGCPIFEGKVPNKRSGDTGAGMGSFPEITRDSVICSFNSLVSQELSGVPHATTRARDITQGIAVCALKAGCVCNAWDKQRGGVLTAHHHVARSCVSPRWTVSSPRAQTGFVRIPCASSYPRESTLWKEDQG